MKNKHVLKYDSYRKDVIQKAATTKGELIGLINAMTSPYLALKTYGVAFMPKAIMHIEAEREKLHKYILEKEKDFERLFTSLTKDNATKFIKEDDPESLYYDNRW